MNKPWGSIMVMLLLIASMMPLAAAQDADGTSTPNVAACLEKCRAEGGDNCRAQCKVKEAREDIREVRQNYVQARERYQETRETFAEHRKAFLASREQWKACKDKQSDECKTAHQDMQKNAKPFLLQSADMVLQALQRVKARLEANEKIDAEKKAELLAKIEARIQAVMDARTKVEAMPDNATPAELKESMRVIRNAWKESRGVLKHGVGEVMVARLGNIIHRSQQLEKKLERISEKLQAKGKDASMLNAILVDFTANLASAEESYNKAVEMFKAVKTSRDAEASVREAHELIVKARTSLNEARQLLKEAVAEIRVQNRGKLDMEGTDADENTTGTTGSANASTAAP